MIRRTDPMMKADPFAIVDPAKSPRLRCRMREQAAVFSCECLGGWLIQETFKKAVGCSFFLYVFGCKGTIFPSHSDTFLQNNYGLIGKCLYNGST